MKHRLLSIDWFGAMVKMGGIVLAGTSLAGITHNPIMPALQAALWTAAWWLAGYLENPVKLPADTPVPPLPVQAVGPAPPDVPPAVPGEK